ncbi:MULTISPECIES: fumarylacetoacetate hydrolase family protein [Vibrio]|uniref:FAA hydrolase family protein n=2 Tax=Vibrio TaxID=662 RepID=A0A7X4RWQ2_9VIBR|nr:MULTISPECIES: fumarylacetoacetate hydrolase family protein [Vibrio]MBF9003508.1 fumarylacetoacetate hydrolase family protein [Vibrio nitrifigilis]MZI95439.1 FAA hydrolase family protein [Vibrio eleionomae]
MNAVKLNDQSIEPSKIVCVGRNYVEHIQELNNAVPDQMVVFHKPNSAISRTLHATHEETLHYETEICFMTKGGQFHAVGLGLDLTKRKLQSKLKEKGLPWERAKAFTGSAVLSKFVPLQGIDISTLNLELLINCVRMQSGGVEQMMYKPAAILDEIKSYTTLEDGDIVMTGTPKGVGEVQPGDIFLGRLKAGDKTLFEIEWVAE